MLQKREDIGVGNLTSVFFTANFHYLQIQSHLMSKCITCKFSAPDLGSVLSFPSGVRDGGPVESAFWCILSLKKKTNLVMTNLFFFHWLGVGLGPSNPLWLRQCSIYKNSDYTVIL